MSLKLEASTPKRCWLFKKKRGYHIRWQRQIKRFAHYKMVRKGKEVMPKERSIKSLRKEF